MTNRFWTSGDPELTDALRAHYAPPADEGYWDALEARDAYASVISAGPPSIETSARITSFPDGDATINDILSH
jgi:hypothetical protein